ncbi:mechanosensitive ion channel protein MscS [Epilithonimonas hispanica]|uniref:Mechanosensitive ion channel protein MscS n=2 Tax=Epilithonimonas hispanica TaxID=358687 RepID=A0A3D9CJV6_9FLAO|nr:mechanosensitive ion channel protein MscS [Epilithonimonas hispanica]
MFSLFQLVGIATLKNDNVFMSLVRDTLRRKQYTTELLRLKSTYTITDSIIKNNMRIMTAKKRMVIDANLNVENAMISVEKKLDKSGVNLFGNEYSNLWNAVQMTNKRTVSQNIKAKWDIERNVVAYYSKYNMGMIFGSVFILLLLTWYVWRNIRYLKATGNMEQLTFLNFKYLNNNILLPLLVIFLNMAIVTNLYAPSLFVDLLQLLLLGILSLLFKDQWPVKSLLNWYYLLAIFIVLCFLDLFVNISFLERCTFIAINVLCIRYGMFQLKSIKEELYINWFFKWASILFIGLNSLSLLFNIFGRVSLSHTLSLAAIVSLTQIIALSVLLKIVLEIIVLQIFVTRVKRGIIKIFDHESLTDTLKKPFNVAVIYMWFMVIASNLNIWKPIYDLLRRILTNPIIIGSVTFTMRGIMLFFFIVWMAHLLQNYVKYFFGELDEEDEQDGKNVNKQQHSRLLIARLVVLIVGYLLAVAASGMPMDKLSIVIGALGVGVGLGLQNIVTNFVSGIILIFDRPIQVGDIIDVNSQSGRVKSMGLRSTKINSSSGAEIIIPNGNILSQNITNWTYTDNLKQVEITFQITGTTGIDTINETINKTLKSLPLIENNRLPQIYYNSVSNENYTVLVKFWCSIYRTEEVLSTVRQELFLNFKEMAITLTI